LVLKGLPSRGGVPEVVGPPLKDCGVPADGEPGVDFFVEFSDIGSAECCRLSCEDVSWDRNMWTLTVTYLDFLHTLGNLALLPGILW
jgi:hypothetical protein